MYIYKNLNQKGSLRGSTPGAREGIPGGNYHTTPPLPPPSSVAWPHFSRSKQTYEDTKLLQNFDIFNV